MAEPPYDPYVPKGDSAAYGNESSRPEMLRAQIQETVKVMQDNVNKVKDRGENLDKLHDKSTALAESAHDFRRGANRVRKRMWWKDMKMRICLVVGIILLLVVIIVPAVVSTRH